jgi:rubredoxin
MRRLEMEIPAKCGNCGYLFPSGYGFDPGGTGVEANMTIFEGSPVSTPCPMCGRRRGRVLAGEYEFVKDTMRFLRGPERTVQELERLAAFLRDAHESNATADEIQERADKEAPEVSSLIKRLLANKPARMELAMWFAIVATLIATLIEAGISAMTDSPEPSQVIYETNNYNVTVQTPPADAVGKVGRNDPCPCGSGKKFKKCHGSPTSGAP